MGHDFKSALEFIESKTKVLKDQHGNNVRVWDTGAQAEFIGTFFEVSLNALKLTQKVTQEPSEGMWKAAHDAWLNGNDDLQPWVAEFRAFVEEAEKEIE